MKIWLHGNGTLKADDDATSVYMYNNGTVANGSDTVAWTLGKGDQNPGNISTGDTSINTPWDETAHVRYSTTKLTAYGVGMSGRTVDNASDFVWVQISLVPESASTHTGTISVNFEASTHWDSAGGGCPCADGDVDNGDGTCTATIYGETTDGYIQGFDAVYATAHSTVFAWNTVQTTLYLGQRLSGDYSVYGAYLEFDTSGIGAAVAQGNLYLTCTTDGSTTDFDVEIIKQDWASPIGHGNKAANYDARLTGVKDVTWRSTVGISTNTPYGSPNLDTSWIEIDGVTQYIVVSSRDLAVTEPTGSERLVLASQEHATQAYRPYLSIIYTPSCSPFLYTYSNGEYPFFSDFIPGATSPEKEYTHFLDITDKTDIIDGQLRLKITEEIDETTYLDRLYLRDNGSRIIELDSMKEVEVTPIMNTVNMFELMTSCSNKQLLRHSDDTYLVMRQGDEYFLEFTVPTYSFDKLEFVAEGYYIEHYR